MRTANLDIILRPLVLDTAGTCILANAPSGKSSGAARMCRKRVRQPCAKLDPTCLEMGFENDDDSRDSRRARLPVRVVHMTL
jgi:hypothetical protein